MPPPTLKDVAELAGVSVGTVSNTINRSELVSERFRIRVEAAIRKLDFHPNHLARALKTSRTRTIGIIVPDMTTPFSQFIHGAEDAAREREYLLIAVNSSENIARQHGLISRLRSQHVDGLLLTLAAEPAPPELISGLTRAGIPVVCIDRVPDRISIDSVSVDDVAAAEMGTDHLLEMGYSRIAILTGPLYLHNEQRRLAGYERSLRRAGIRIADNLVWQGNLSPKDRVTTFTKRFQDGSSRPDALLCTHGAAALGVLCWLYDRGLKPPGDIGLVTFDELDVPDLFTPAITRIVQPARDIGRCAVEILIRRIEQSEHLEGLFTVRLPATLSIRDSSSPHRVA